MAKSNAMQIATASNTSMLLVVDRRGMAQLQASIPKEQVIEWLRTMAASLESGAATVGQLQP